MPENTITSREQWLELRRNNIGASEVASLFGCQFADAPSLFELWQIKSGHISEPELKSERIEAGMMYEEATAHRAAKMLGLDILKSGYWKHPRIKGMGATPDYLCMAHPGGIAAEWLVKNGVNPESVGNLECKTVDYLEHKRAWSGEPPLRVLLQDQHQKACIECEWGVLYACVGGNHWTHEFTIRRPATIDRIERRVVEFWESIRTGQVPDPDSSKSTARALAALYPEDDGEPPVDMTWDNEMPDLCLQWQVARDLRRQYENTEREASNRLIAKLGERRSAWCNGWVVSATTIGAIPDRAADPGEIIKGRRGYRRLSVRENVNV